MRHLWSSDLIPGTRRSFSLREVVPNDQNGVRKAQTFNIPLSHNSVSFNLFLFKELPLDKDHLLFDLTFFDHDNLSAQLTIMHASCQERFKHSIPPQPSLDLFRPSFPKTPSSEIEPSNCRINITFRFYRPDFRPPSIPRCRCDVPTILRPDMKNRNDQETDRYWWTCYAGAQNDGKGCNFWKVMDMEAEGRGPYFRPIVSSRSKSECDPAVGVF